MKRMNIRAAQLEDAPALGRVMVESWLAAHRGQIPDAAWRARVEEWTPEVSARGWARVIDDIDQASVPDSVLLVAENDSGLLVGLVHGLLESDDEDGVISSLYVPPGHDREGIGSALLRAAARALRDLGAHSLRLSVLTANLPARSFYDAMGGRTVGTGTTDEDGHLLPTTLYEWDDTSVLVRG